MGSSHSSYHLAKFVGLAPCESKDEIIFDLPRDHLIDLSRDFAGEVPSS